MDRYTYDLIEVKYLDKYLTSVSLYSQNNEIWLVFEDYNTSSYNPTYEINLKNNELLEYKTIRCKEFYIAERIETVFKRWADLEIKKHQKELIQSVEEKVNILNNEILEFTDAVSTILKKTLDKNDEINWSSLKDNRPFVHPMPSEPIYSSLVTYPDAPTEPSYKKYREKPNKDHYPYSPKFNLWDKISTASKQRKIKDAELLLEKSLELWTKETEKIDNENYNLERIYNNRINKYNQECLDVERQIESFKKNYKDKVDEWKNEKEKFILAQNDYNTSINTLEKEYKNKRPNAILNYNVMVLDNSIYPDFIDKLFHLEYLDDSGIIIVDYLLPQYDHIPTTKNYKYIKSRNDITERKFSETELNRLYESMCYQLCIRTLHEIIEADKADAVNELVFNGYASEINPATGHLMEHCILSVRTKKTDFLQINLEGIDPKVSFKEALKGKSYARLTNFSEIEPLLKSSREWSFKRKPKKIEEFSKEEILNNNSDIAEIDNEETLNIAVKGLSFRSTEEQIIASTLEVGDILLLESEPDNKFDSFAIKVITEGNTHIGYVEKDYSQHLSTKLDNVITCKVSKITAGKHKDIPYIYADITIKD